MSSLFAKQRSRALDLADLSVAEAGFHSASERRAGRVQSHLTWAAAGFIIGVVFWHLVGFWSLVSEVLDSTPPRATLGSVLFNGEGGKDASPIPAEAVRTVGAERSNCTALVIDRTTGETYSRPCQPLLRARLANDDDQPASRWPLLTAHIAD